MSTPRHRSAPGTSYFVTTKCWQGRSLFQVKEIAEILVDTILHYRDAPAYLLHEFVVMPDHLHVLLTPAPTTSLERAIQLIKGGSSHRIHKQRDQRMEIWQVGFHDWTIRDYDDWLRKAEYVRSNPVRARLVEKPEDWPYSSATGNFALDPVPAKYLQLASGAKAHAAATLTSELKLRPPKEGTHPPLPPLTQPANLGPKGPIPKAALPGTSERNPVPTGIAKS
jgi:putative transposase